MRMYNVSPKIEGKSWRGILGDTQYSKKYNSTGREIVNDRYLLLVME